METEIIKGALLHDSDIYYTKTGKMLGKVRLKTEEEIIYIVAWEENAEILSELNKDDIIIIKGYRKFNDFTKREEFIIMQFIKREKGE